MSKRRRKEVLSDSELKHILNCSDSDSFEDDIEDDFDRDWQAENLEEGEESEEGDEESEGEDLQQIIDDLRVEEEIIDEEAIMEEEDNSIVQEGNGNWTEYVGRHQIFQFRGKNGLQRRIEANSSPLDIFLLLVDDDVWNHIVYQTNNYAQQCQAAQQLSGRKKFARLNQWKPTDVAEMKKFFGLMLWMGLVPLGTIPDYWTTKKIYKQEIPRSVMSRNRFQLLLSLVHFNDNKNEQEKQQLGRLAKIQPLLNILQEKFKCLYYPGEDFVIDETLVPWRGRLIFRQYIPNKTHRYGIKLFKLCSTTGYTWALKVYSGKSTTGIREVGLATNVCLELAEGLLHEGRTLYVDNFYTSYEMAKQLLVKETHLVGTLRANKKDIPKEVLLKKLKRGEIISREDQSGVVVLKWRDTRDVRLLSTKHSPALVPLATRQNSTINEQEPSTINQEELSTTNPDQEEPIINHDQPSTGNIVPRRKRKSTRAESKPEGILAYNKGKSGIDLSDQMASYATTLRKGVKWYRKLGVELVLGIALVNAWIVYNNITKKKIQIRNFRELLVIELLQLEDKDRDCRISEKSMHRLLQRKNDKGKKIRRKCSNCYAIMKKEVGREEARKKSKMITTYCNTCTKNPQMCLDCFNEVHK